MVHAKPESRLRRDLGARGRWLSTLDEVLDRTLRASDLAAAVVARR